MKKHVYFVSYNINQVGGGISGHGNAEAISGEAITQMAHIQDVARDIAEKASKECGRPMSVTIMNYQLLRVDE